MKAFGIFFVCVMTGGRVDYLFDANRPWVVDFRNQERRPGRGSTLIEAWKGYWA